VEPYQIAELLTENVNFNNGILLEAAFSQKSAQDILSKPSVVTWIQKHVIPKYNPSNLEYLGSGGKSQVFRYDNKALKITTDAQEATQAQKAIGIKHPNLAFHYGSSRIGGLIDNLKNHRIIYLIITEYVNTNIPQKLKIAANAIGGYLDKNQVFPPYNIKEATDYIVKYNNIEDQQVSEYITELLNILNDFRKTISLDYRDVGATNTGMLTGKIKLFDLGQSVFR
jgi:hypothetical protein